MISTSASPDLVDQIKAEAYRLGFCLFGISSAETPEHYTVYEDWLETGLNGGMEYLKSERHRSFRRDPYLLLEGVSSIIVLGWPYDLTVPSAVNPGGLIAGYALQPDYHITLPVLMHQLVDFINQVAVEPVKAKCVTDSAPLLERELGQRAGLGWIGKNSCLISPEKGSSFLLAEILLTLNLPTSQPFEEDRCGTCRRCLDACPTGCIQPDRTLDAAKCISYLTIENKGAIPPDLRGQVGNWVFGCDICQSVCPWNKKQKGISENRLLGRTMPPEEMIHLLNESDEEFRASHQDSPVLRSRWKGYQRNLIIALANLGEKKAVPVLKTLLDKSLNGEEHEFLEWAIAKLA